MSSRRAQSAKLREEGARLGAEPGLGGFRDAYVSSFHSWAYIIPPDVLFLYDEGVARREAGWAPVTVRWGELATLTLRYALEENASVSYLVVQHAAAAHPHVNLKFGDPDKRVPFQR